MSAAVVLEAVTLTRRFRSRQVVDGASFELTRGRWTSLLGPSGSGKTTLLQMVGLLDCPDGGRVLVSGQDAWALDDNQRADLRLTTFGFVFEAHNLIDHLSVRDNVALPLWHREGSRRGALDQADMWLERFGLRACAHAPARQLSAGEAQRSAVARALINGPTIVLADEPTGKLDSHSARVVLDALGEVCAAGTALLVVTHDREIAARGEVLELGDGRLSRGG